jgi:murein DD-endopeptidase MepM/ murein hydrolase activator NlpD
MEEDLADRARQVFMQGSTTELNWLLAATDATMAMDRAAFSAVVQNRELAGLEETAAARASLDQLTALASQRRSELLELEDELRQHRTDLEHRLEEATARVVLLEAVGDRPREISQGDQQGTYACPMDPSITHFIDSWGFPRSGGRRHQGTDIMGPMGVEVYAFTDGVISRHSNSRLGGISLYLRGDDGNTYFYAHLQGYAPKGAVGTRVHAGEHIAYNGNTGNARGGAPHIHFERHPGGGSPVNPYRWLANACF